LTYVEHRQTDNRQTRLDQNTQAETFNNRMYTEAVYISVT